MAAGPAGAADAVDVILVLVGHVVVKHRVHVVDIQPPGGHVGGGQHPYLAVPELLQGLLPEGLGDVAVDGLAGDAPHLQKSGQPVGHVFGVAEGNHPLVVPHLQQPGHDVRLLPPVGVQTVLGDVGPVLLVGLDGDLHRLPLVDPGDIQHLPGDGGGEHAQVFPVGHLVQNVGHIPDKAHVQHPVGLVQHHRLHLVQPDGAPLHVVHQPPRCGNHNLRLFLQLVDLSVDGLAAVEAHHPHPLFKGAQVPQFVLDLDGQFPGGGQHQAGDVGGGRVGVLHHGDAEGEGLASTRGGLGNHVLPVHKPGDGPGLDGGGLHIALLLDGPHQLR